MSFTIAAMALCSLHVCASFNGTNWINAGLARFCRRVGIGQREKPPSIVGPSMVEPPVAFLP